MFNQFLFDGYSHHATKCWNNIYNINSKQSSMLQLGLPDHDHAPHAQAFLMTINIFCLIASQSVVHCGAPLEFWNLA